MKTVKLLKGQDVYFQGEDLPMKVKVINKKYAVCTRPLDKVEDADLLEYKVEMKAYSTFEKAYKSLKNEVIYTILDFENGVKGPHNLVFNDYNFRKQRDMAKLLKDLESGDVEVSRRNQAVLRIDYAKMTSQYNEN